MNPQTTNQEILLFTNTSFSKKELCERDESDAPENSPADQLEKACWSGLIFEMLPELAEYTDQKNIYVLKIVQAEQFIYIAIGNEFCSGEYETSIDPHFFLNLAVNDN